MSRGSFSRNTGQFALLILRLGLGVDLAMHGLVRIPKLAKFADKMVSDFSATILPEFFVRGFAFTLPFVELAIGVLLFLGGRFLVWGGLLGGLTMTALIFGTGLREEWNTVSIQLIHVLAFYFLLKEAEER
ncbi:MauE/DoxX family redox-associated membrane protein [Larkinella humicola]|uniref:DoxX family protein n=1 Tax=Larkinella humicola TaxID=2607654 RepID=A0A5N1JQV2_9BACT|nr:DoxX family protein [Larkinella humicola]KAA9356692.1 DoxX family protein [Larkinella humicola]